MKGRKTQQPAEHIRENPEKKKKKKPETRKREEPGSVGLGCAWRSRPSLAWVARTARSLAWPGSRTARAACPTLAWVLLSVFLYFFFSLWVLLGLGSSLAFISFINQVLKTRFLYAHVEKYVTSEIIRP